jgi:hypothetical protein
MAWYRESPADDGAGVAVVPTVDAADVLASHTYALADAGMPGMRPLPICAECYDDWRGDDETGGCPAVLLAREVVALRERAATAERRLRDWEAYRTNVEDAEARVALLEGLLRDLVTKGEAMKEALFTGNDTQEAIACMEWDDAVGAALADGG